MTPKRQHFTPRLHLQHFAGSDPKGQVWTYDKQTGAVRSAIPEETAIESHFYSVEKPDGTMDTRIEDYLAGVESTAAPIYEALLRGKIPDAQERADFSTFLALMHTRTPAMRRMRAESYGQFLQVLTYAYGANPKAFEKAMEGYEKESGRTITPEMKEQVRQSMLDPSHYIMEIPKERTLSALPVADELAPLFYRMKWSLIRAGQGFFITSDNSLVREVDPRSKSPFYGDGGFLNKTAEITFPLSPKLMLIMSWNPCPRLENAERDLVDGLNRARAAHADRYLYAHLKHKHLQRLSADFKDARPGMKVQGFGPKKFAEVKVRRRSRKK